MFPESFAEYWIKRLTKPDDDPEYLKSSILLKFLKPKAKPETVKRFYLDFGPKIIQTEPAVFRLNGSTSFFSTVT